MSTEASTTSPGVSPSLSGSAAPSSHEHAQSSQDRPLEVRFLIEHSLVGGVIGTSGANVKHVRNETGTFVTILPSSAPHQSDRIMQLRGEVEDLAKAVSMIADLVIEAQMYLKSKNAEAAGQPKSERRPEKVAFRMLVHMTTAGAIIGKGAMLLKETQDTADVRISVSPMPLPGSTEKTVTVTGTPAALQIAFARMFQQLKDCPPPRSRPTLYNPSAQPAMPQYYQPAAPMYPQMHAYPNAAAPGPTSTQKIAVPSVCAGCIIGRGGTVIRDLRARSGAQISIQDADPKTPTERVVTLTGTPQAIQNAVFMIRQLVEQYQPRQPAGGDKY